MAQTTDKILQQIREGAPIQNFSMDSIHHLIQHLDNQNKQLADSAGKTLESELKYKSLFEMSDDAILVIENNTFIDCNQAVINLLGYKRRIIKYSSIRIIT